MEQKCKNCKWHDDFSWVCFNGDAERRADYTSNDDSCKCWEELKMDANEYQKLAARTINFERKLDDIRKHALHGMVGEIGELHSLYQKEYQGHVFEEYHAKKEVGDLLWFVAEYCTAMGWNLAEVMQTNIEKLQARYPDGFKADRSLNRAEGDI